MQHRWDVDASSKELSDVWQYCIPDRLNLSCSACERYPVNWKKSGHNVVLFGRRYSFLFSEEGKTNRTRRNPAVSNVFIYMSSTGRDTLNERKLTQPGCNGYTSNIWAWERLINSCFPHDGGESKVSNCMLKMLKYSTRRKRFASFERNDYDISLTSTCTVVRIYIGSFTCTSAHLHIQWLEHHNGEF